MGYWKSALLFGAAIGVVAIAYFVFKLNEVVAFWIAIHPHPSARRFHHGDFLSQPRADGGLG